MRSRRVILPAASPQIFAGLRISLALALILMVVSEMVAGTNGVGYFVLQSQRRSPSPRCGRASSLLGVLGYGLNACSPLLERRVLRLARRRWQRPRRVPPAEAPSSGRERSST